MAAKANIAVYQGDDGGAGEHGRQPERTPGGRTGHSVLARDRRKYDQDLPGGPVADCN